MKTMRIAFGVLATWVGLTTGWAATTVPGEVNYQGMLVRADNTPLANGNYQVQFRIYNQPTGGSLIWGPQSNTVALYNGQFNVKLGPVDAASRKLAEAFQEPARYFEIQVGTNPPISPRQQMLSAPFALNADLLNGTNWSAVFDNGNPATGTILSSKIGTGAITSSHIADGTIQMVDLGPINRLSAPDGDPANAVYVDATGNVGIGTTVPADLLEVYRGNVRVRGTSLVGPYIVGRNATPYSLLSSNRLVLRQATSAGSGTVDPVLEFLSSSTDVPISAGMRYDNGDLVVFGADLVVGNDVYVGSAQLHCNVTGSYLYLQGGAGLWVSNHMVIEDLPTTSSGANVYANAAGLLYRSTSSRRYKEQIEPLQTDFAKILNLEPKQYLRKGAGPEREFGYIAEEVEDAGLKGLTVYDGQGRPDGVDYPRMVIYANEVLKQHQGTIQKQQEEIESLKAELAELKKLIRQSR